MKLSDEQIKDYHQNGYLLIERVFIDKEIEIIKREMSKIITEDCPRRILEKNGSVRSFFAPDLTSELFYKVVRLRRLVEPSSQLIGSGLYIHQTKLNTKYSMEGDWWKWHQDYTFWKRDDGMPRPQVLTAMVYLNDVNEFNGPLLLIPGSHEVMINDVGGNNVPQPLSDGNLWYKEYQASKSYMSALTSDLKYTIDRDVIAQWSSRNGIYSAKGAAGSVLFFHGNIFHASSNNLSPWDRHMFLITYNSLDNSLPNMDNPRPEFIANRKVSPVLPVDDNTLLEFGNVR